MKKKKIWIALVCLAILMAAAGVFVLTKDPVAPVGGEVNNPSEENSVASDTGSHNFSAEWQADAAEHWQICLDPNCTEHTNRGAHSGGEATCTEQAICSICGLPYGETLGHDFGSYTVDIEPTCTTPGSKSRHCARCGEAADVTVIPATGHSYSSKWTYSAYGHWHTATCGHSVTSGYAPHTGGTATCTEQAICAVCGRAYGEPLGHDFEPYYTVDINPTCTTQGSKSYHCARCGAKTGVTVIPATGHAFASAWTSDGTNHWHICTNAGCTEVSGLTTHRGGTATCTETAKCEVCGTSYGTALGHDFSEAWTSDGTNHWHICTHAGCTEVSGSAEHTGGTATCTEKAKCAVCNAPYGEPLGHNFSTTWTTDGDDHWHVCTRPGCTEVSGSAEHTGGTATCTGQAVCEICGVPYGTPLEHDFSAAWTSDGENHWHACTRTGCTEVSGSTAHSGGEATCTEKAVCEVCDAPYGEPLGHDFATTWTTDGDSHWHVCTRPGCTEVSGSAAHSGGTATCTEKAVCEVCGTSYGEPLGHGVEAGWTATSLGHYHMPTCEHTLDAETVSYALHSGGTATCTEQAVCEVCGASYGLPLSHQFSADWTSDGTNHWHVCTCEGCEGIGDSEAHFGGEATCTAKAVCAVCGASYGEPLGHDFDTEFTIDIEATCGASGIQSCHCTRCDATTDTTLIPKVEHDWGDWSTIIPATCTATGLEKRICNNDSAHTEERVLPVDPNAHEWDWNWSSGTVTAPATCDQNGEMTFACGNGCGHTEKLTIPSSAHNHVVNIVQPANGKITVTYADGTPIASGTAVSCGTILKVTATPDTGYHLVANSVKAMVSGVDRYVKATGTFTAKYDTATVEAAMAPNTYTINTGATEGITVAPSGPLTVNHGANQTFTITANEGYLIRDVFTGDTADSLVYAVQDGALESYVYEFKNVTANQTLNVNFVPASKITASAGDGGTISPAGVTKVANRADVDDDGNQTYTITANPGYRLKAVYVDAVDVTDELAAGTYTFLNVVSNHTIEVEFIKQHTVTLSVVGNGGTVMGSTVTVDEGADTGTFTVKPNPGYVASIRVDAGAEVTLNGNNDEDIWHYTFENVIAPHEITVCFAAYEAPTQAITSSADGNGTISPGGTVNVVEGEEQTFTIAPRAGYRIKDVLVDGASVGAVTSYTFNSVTAPHTISATFEQLTYTLTASAGANGTISSPGDTAVAYNGSKTYTIAANANCKIKDVLVDGVSVGAVTSYTFTNVTAPHTIAATFEPLANTIMASASEGGAISSPGVTAVAYNGSQAYTITPSANYRVADVRVDGASVGAVTSYTFSNVTASHTIAATFEPMTYEITAPLPVHGSIGPRVSTFVPHGGSQTYTITPDTGYSVKDVTVDGVSVGAVTTYTFTNITAAHTIEATFGFAITVSAGEHGTISPSSTVVEHGGTVTFTITPDAGYGIDRAWVDGHSIGAAFSHSLTDVTAAHTISAAFERISYWISIPFTMFGTITPVGSQYAAMGDTVTLQIAPNSGFNLVAGSLTVTDAGGTTYPVSISEDGKTATFTMPAARVTVNAAFEQTSYAVTVGTVAHGSVSVLTAAPYCSPNLITVSLTPQSMLYGLKAGTLKVTGADGTTYPIVVAADGKTAFFRMPAQNVTVTAEFERLPATVGIWPSATNTYTIERDNSVACMLTAPFGEFTGVMLGGQKLNSMHYAFQAEPPGDTSRYTGWAAHGQTFFYLRTDYLDDLDPGTYTFTICFRSGTVDLQVIVQKNSTDGGFTRGG